MSHHLTSLTVTRHGANSFRYSLEIPQTGMVKVWDVLVNHEEINSLSNMIARAIRSSAKREVFARHGRALYNALMPRLPDPSVRELRDTLRQLRTPLLITTEDPSIHWELLNDGEEFLGVKLDLGRRLFSRAAPIGARTARTGWRCLVIGDPNHDEPAWALPAASEETNQLHEWFQARGIKHVDFLCRGEATFEEVLDRLASEAYDIIHYAGHVVAAPDRTEYALRLNGGTLFSASTIKNQVRGEPIVFLNSCWSGKARGLANPLGSIEGLTDAFLEAGSRAVIGSLFEAPDAGSRVFAESFYSSILEGSAMGEAMREARNNVLSKPECGATWACFVMYGDPRFRIEPGEIQAALAAIGLSRDQFGEACCQTLEKALDYSGTPRVIESMQLFLAMIDGKDRTLWNGLQSLGVPVTTLRDKLAEMVSQGHRRSSISLGRQGARFSEGAAQIVHGAADLAKQEGRALVSELDLLKSFVRTGGSRAGEILQEIEIDLRQVVQVEPIEKPAPLKIGPLNEQECEPDVWQVLLAAGDLAVAHRFPFIGTPQLFESLRQDPHGPLARGLKRFGGSLPTPVQAKAGRRTRLGPEVPCSENVSEILLLAQANAAAKSRERVDLGDILSAFVRQGGGETGKDLRRNGIYLEAALSRLFLDSGDVDFSRFADPVRAVFDEALDFARRKNHDRCGREHLLYGLLLRSEELKRRLRNQGIEPRQVSQIAERLYALLPGEVSSSSRAELKLARMEAELLKVLWIAEAKSEGEGSTQLSETHLIEAWTIEGGGKSAELLIACGVSLRQLATPDV